MPSHNHSEVTTVQLPKSPPMSRSLTFSCLKSAPSGDFLPWAIPPVKSGKIHLLMCSGKEDRNMPTVGLEILSHDSPIAGFGNCFDDRQTKSAPTRT
jgi:hypothetical protein